MISLDQTLLFQIVGFFVLLIILNRLLYRPVQRILKERDERIAGSLKKAAGTEKEVAEGLLSYEKRLKEAAMKGHEERGRLRQEGVDREKIILEAARSEAAAELAKIRKELDSSRQGALSGLKTEARGLAREIAGKVLDRSVAGLIALFILIPSVAFASAGGDHGNGMLWKIGNFIVLAVGVYLVWTKAINKLLDKRSAEIKTALESAQAAKDEAERKAAEYRAKLNILDSRIAEIQKELRAEGESERERIIAEAGKSAERLKEQAKAAAEQEIKKAKIEIREEAARAAVELAEEILKKEFTPADQDRLVKGYLNNLRIN
ncbi:MAG: ATP synthase F0 subunit B [Deltaproteobacteria bacterium]|nr:ATP synthase F0 subunit B [Deltaproteobacteria bacterium]MBZ0220026.1 ATP synthase F0 subunit B [Deltaproteobacteria bacterium]